MSSDKNKKYNEESEVLEEPYKGYWGDVEDFVNEILEENIIRFPKLNNRRLLDIGCGKGRHLIKFMPLFDEGVGIDPDESRIGAYVTVYLSRPQMEYFVGGYHVSAC